MALSKASQSAKKLNELAKEKKSLLDKLGVKIRKKVYNLNGNLAFVEDHPRISLELVGAKLEGEVEMDEISWEKMKIDGRTHNIKLAKRGKNIVGYRKGSKKVVG